MNTAGKSKWAAAALIALATFGAHAHDGGYEHVEVEGPAKVIDANHLEIEGERIRLGDMEAPTNEWCKECGDRAKLQLQSIIGTGNVWCHQLAHNRTGSRVDGAALAMCQIRTGKKRARIAEFDTRSINWHMVWSGWAYAFQWQEGHRAELGKAITDAGAKARAAKKGMWRNKVQIPERAMARWNNPAWVTMTKYSRRGRTRIVGPGILEIGNITVQLAGIVPARDEWCIGSGNQGCGKRASEALKTRTQIAPMTCIPNWPKSTASKHVEAMCTTRDIERDGPCETPECWINWQLVAKGHAVARRKWADLEGRLRHKMATMLVFAEEDAIVEQKGMWRDDVDIRQIEEQVEDRFAPLNDGSNVAKGRARTGSFATVRVGERELVLFGLGFPRPDWCKGRGNRDCQIKAADAFDEAMDGKEVRCSWVRQMTWRDRKPKAICRVEGQDRSVNEQLIEAGWVLAWRAGSLVNRARVQHRWAVLQREAKHERRGMWEGRVSIPRSWQKAML